MAVVGTAERKETGWRGAAMIGAREWSVLYKVTCDSIHDGPAVALTASGLPELGDYYAAGNDVSTFAIMTRADVVSQTATADGSLFIVECQYSTVSADQRAWQLPSPEASPLDEPPIISLTQIEYTRTQHYKYVEDGFITYLRTTAGEPFSIEVPDSRPQLTIRRNEAVTWAALAAADAYTKTRNLNSYNSVGAGRALMQNIDISSVMWKGGTEFVEVTYIIELDRNQHVIERPVMGVYEKRGINAPPTRIQMDDGTFAMTPQYLNEDGAFLDVSTPPFPDPVIEYIQPYKALDWTALNLPIG